MNGLLVTIQTWFSNGNGGGGNGLRQPLLPITMAHANGVNNNNGGNSIIHTMKPNSTIIVQSEGERKTFVEKYCEIVRKYSGREAQNVTDLMLGISYGYNNNSARSWWIQKGHFFSNYCINHFGLQFVSVCDHKFGKFLIYSNADIRDCLNRIIAMFKESGIILIENECVPWHAKYDDPVLHIWRSSSPADMSSSSSDREDEEDEQKYVPMNSILIDKKTE